MSGRPRPALDSAVHHVFVDCENVQSFDGSALPSGPVHLTLLFGSNQKRVELSFLEPLLNHAASAKIVRLETGGKNALDLTLAYYVGCCLANAPAARIHIVSKDRGYDPLVTHLNREETRAWRHDDFRQLPFVARVPLDLKPEHHELADLAVAKLERDKTSRPLRRKKLISYLRGPLKISGGDIQLDPVIEILRQRGLLQICEKGLITYPEFPR